MIHRMRRAPTGPRPDLKQAPPNGGLHCGLNLSVGRETLVLEYADGAGERSNG